jgi:multidrug efflux pump subunit AcrB
MVDIVTQSPGLSSEEIERYITIPIETQVAGIKNLRTIRTISLYGLSDIKLQFSFDYTYDEALQQVLNRLSQLAPLPGNVLPQISPLSAIGEIYRYRLVGPPNYSVLDLKTLQDWVLQRRFRAVPGVIDVTGWGGKTKTYELQVDFNKLIAYGLTLPQLLQAVSNSNIDRRSRQYHGVAKRRQPGAGQGYRHRHRRREAAARHRRSRSGRRYRAGHRADAPRRAEFADHRPGRAIGGLDQQLQHPAAGRADRANL